MYLKEGTVLQGGRYRIVRYISSGGFGCTYQAEHSTLTKKLAIKEFFVKDFCNRDEATSRVTVGTLSKTKLVDKLKRKFVDEANALSSLKHPGIVAVNDVFEENGTVYYVMDFIDGKSLSQMLKQGGPLPEAQALKYIRQVAQALDYVHKHNRLHLDLKPGNILVDEDDNAILIDFGASKQYDEDGGENTSTLMGLTPGYAPLEQMSHNVTKFLPATDIYALGATLYKLVTGITPIDATQRAAEDCEVEIPSNISPATAQAILRAMTLNKNRRPQSIGEFLAILDGQAQPMGQPRQPAPASAPNEPTMPTMPCDDESTSLDSKPASPAWLPPVDQATQPTMRQQTPPQAPQYEYEEEEEEPRRKMAAWALAAIAAVLVIGACVFFISKRPSKDAAVPDDSIAIENALDDDEGGGDTDALAIAGDAQQQQIAQAGPVEDFNPNDASAVQNTYIEIVDDDEVVNVVPTQSSTGNDDLTKSAIKEEVVVAEPKKTETERTYTSAEVEQQPSFPGGEAMMYKWLRDNLKYPPAAQEENAWGRVVVEFVVSKTGSIENVKVVRGTHPALDKEAVRLIQSMPQWTPGNHHGQPVRVTYTIPITFQLQKPTNH